MRGMCMKNMILRMKQKFNKRYYLYRKEPFPYNMKAVLAYAEEKGVPVYTLTEEELAQFLLKRPAR